MICILKLDSESYFKGPTGWIIANDIPDAIEKAYSSGNEDVATLLVSTPNLKLKPGRHFLKENLWAIVS